MHRIDFLLQNIKPGKMLDVGNLNKGGAIHKMLIEKFPQVELYGLDIMDQARLGINFSNQKKGSFEDMDYPEDFFDTIYMGEVLEHTWKPKQALDQSHRILKTGGFLIIDTPNVYSLSRILRYLIKGQDIILGNPDHKIFYSRAMLENMLKQSGFSIKKMMTEVNFDTMKFKFKLPNFGPFKFMGECLLVLAEKF